MHIGSTTVEKQPYQGEVLHLKSDGKQRSNMPGSSRFINCF